MTHQCQSSMSAHTVSKNTDPFFINLLERRKHRIGQLGRDVAVHFVTFGPRFSRCVDVEAGARTKVVRIIFALDFETAWRIRQEREGYRLVNVRSRWFPIVAE